MKKIAIVGGGLAGLTSAILLARKGFDVTLFEEKKYPFHRVCGEYISNEVIPFLHKNHLYPQELNPWPITTLRLTAPSGISLISTLDLGGFGISRYVFDEWLSQKAGAENVEIIYDRVTGCKLNGDYFHLETRSNGNYTSDITIGSFGKRSTLDKKLNRNFISHRYPYIGVKYHLKTEEVDNNYIELHNFKGGYCGISRVENGIFNLCYLSHRKNLRNAGSIPEMEEHVLFRNPYLKRIFRNSDFLFDKPEVINEITFKPKEPVFNHILMSGDSAGMITPLCGNGMAMAIHSAKIVSELIIENVDSGFNRKHLESEYTKVWNNHFVRRLWAGRKIQNLFGGPLLSEIAIGLGKLFPPFTKKLMVKTHGQMFS
ncbi:MAG: NAD(P)/FAD-dependent oxidoreductase [Bacteroidota bacterium]